MIWFIVFLRKQQAGLTQRHRKKTEPQWAPLLLLSMIL
jgi:hypothetical protein